MSEKQPLRTANSIDTLRLTVEQAAEALNDSHSHAFQRIREGALRPHEDGRLTFCARAELHRSIAVCEAASHPTAAIQMVPVCGVYDGEVPPPRDRKPLRIYGLGGRGPPAPNTQAMRELSVASPAGATRCCSRSEYAGAGGHR